VDEQVERTSRPSQRLTFRFNLDEYEGQQHRLTITTSVKARLRKHTKTIDYDCRSIANETICTRDISHEYDYHTETITLSDEQRVSEQQMQVSGYRARYPNGDLGLVVYQDEPWLGHSVPDGEVHGTWRFYSARDPQWDELIRSTEDSECRLASPSHPLQVNAFPMETGPSATRRSVTILDAYGESMKPLSLPEQINLDAMTEPYTASFGLATRISDVGRFSGVRARGLVRGTNTRVPASEFTHIPINRSSLQLSVVDLSENTTTLRVRLLDNATEEPIATIDRDGYVVLNGHRLNTTANGTATITVEGLGGVFTARYEPGHWWRNTPGYVRASDTRRAGGPAIQVVATLFRFAVPVGLILLAVYLVDRITHWQLWPPWRGM